MLGRHSRWVTLWAGLAACSDTHAPTGIEEDASTGNTTTLAAYTAVAAEDWQSYQTSADLRSSNLFWWYRSEDVYNYVDITQDPTFGNVARITFAQSDETGFSPKLARTLPQALDRVWFRFRVKFAPGFTTAGPYPVGHANSYKLAFWTWEGFGGRGQIEFSNTTQYIIGLGVNSGGTYFRYNETPLPGSLSWGSVTTEWTDGEWWEYVVYYEKTGATSARNHLWRRRLTNGGVIANNPFTYWAVEISGSTTPRVRAVDLGPIKNKSNPTTMHLYWGPWEVVDGSAYPNPFGMPNISGAPPAPILTRLILTPDSAAVSAGGVVQFQVTGQLSDGSFAPASAAYSVTAGAITPTGLYTAPTAPGTYQVIARSGTLADTSRVRVAGLQVPSLVRINVTPDSVNLTAGQSAQFQTTGIMSDGTVGNVTVNYTATGGSISSNGTYTAGASPGVYRVIATAQAAPLADTARIRIVAPAPVLSGITLTPATASLPTGGGLQFQTVARFSDGSTSPVTASYQTNGGTISASGSYVAPAVAGNYVVIAMFSGHADTSLVTVTATLPNPGSYQSVLSYDWRNITDKSGLSGLFSWRDARDVYAFVDLLPDPLFGQVVRITQPGGITATPEMTRSLPRGLGKMWLKYRVKFSPGWRAKTSGSAPGLYMLGEWRWDGYSGYGGTGFNNSAYQTWLSVRSPSGALVRYTESVLGDTSLGSVTNEWSSGEWYEFVVYWEKTGATTARQHLWMRQMTNGGAPVNGGWRYSGVTLGGATTPLVGTIAFGSAKSQVTSSTQYVYWGPWEVVDGSAYPNPWGMPNL